MAIYEYRCDLDGVFEVSRPLGTAPQSVTCSICGGEARRIVSMPMILSGSRSAWSAAIERAEKSRHEPEVVTSLPSTGARRRTTVLPLTPTLRGLPRP
jgi:putative FmdB family regulatory protein